MSNKYLSPKTLSILGSKHVLEALVVGRYKRFRSDNARIGEIAGAVAQAAGYGNFKVLVFLFGQSSRIDHLGPAFIRPIDSAGFVKVSTVATDTFLFTADIKLFETEIGG
jgi:hypothetical protein